MAKTIVASVGINGKNFPDDSLTVQQLLNNVPPARGGPVPLLVEDGICGPKTKAAIQKFQLAQFGWPGCDGRVDPDGPTMIILNMFDKPAPPVTPPVPPPLE